MTDKQPEALRLADMVDQYLAGVHHEAFIETYSKVATELRRLHEVNAELVEALRWCATSLNPNHERTAFVFAALAKAQGDNK